MLYSIICNYTWFFFSIDIFDDKSVNRVVWNISDRRFSASILCWFWMRNIPIIPSGCPPSELLVEDDDAVVEGELRLLLGGVWTLSRCCCQSGSSPTPDDSPLSTKSVQNLRCFTPYLHNMPLFSKSRTSCTWSSFHTSLSLAWSRSSFLFLLCNLSVEINKFMYISWSWCARISS